MKKMLSNNWSRRAIIGAVPLVGGAAVLSLRAKTPPSLADSLRRANPNGDHVSLPDRGGTRWRKVGRRKLDPGGEGMWWFTAATGEHWVLAENPLRPEHLGATGKGNEFRILQQWADRLGGGVNGVLDGSYQIGAQVRFARQRDFKIHGTGKLKLATGAPVRFGFSALVFSDCSDFELSGLTLNGNRAGRLPAPQPAHTVQFLSCHRFRVADVICEDAVADGFYLASSTPENVKSHCSDFEFEHCIARNGFRQGMSIIQGHSGVLRNCSFLSTAGHAPQAGVDLESNRGNPEGSISDILFEHCKFSGNGGYGLQVSSKSLPANILVRNCIFEDNARGPIIWGATAGEISDPVFIGISDIAKAVKKTGDRKKSRFKLIRPHMSE